MELHLFGVYCSLMITMLMIPWSRVNSFNLDVNYPIIFEDRSSNMKHGSYFGYSLIMYSNENKNWIMVGAPRANSTDSDDGSTKQTGEVYKCSLSPPGTCNPVIRKTKVYLEDDRLSLDGALIGGSLAVQEGPDGRVVACGPHRIFSEDKDTTGGTYDGICFFTPVEKLYPEAVLPLQNPVHPKENGLFNNHYEEAGISVNIPLLKNEKDKKKYLIGVPGSKGGFILYEDEAVHSGHSKREVGKPKEHVYKIKSGPYSYDHEPHFGYLGYQVASGYFLENSDKPFYVVTAPRADNLKGKVLKFGLLETKNKMLYVKKYVGYQTGEYFGASIAIGDLNSDGLDDIIVGAPLYQVGNPKDGKRIGYDEGRIEVIISPQYSQKEPEKFTGNVAGGRFGSAVSFLGNLYSDSSTEIGIGAPYEDDGRGVVYILSFDSKSHWEYSQRLVAREIYPNLKGFGYYIIVHPVDIDANKYSDVAVGAYESGHAVVFRGKPVLEWKLGLMSEKDAIPVDSSYLVFNACIEYKGEKYIKNIDVDRILQLDPQYKRCHLNGKNNDSKHIRLELENTFCEVFNVTMESSIKDVTHALDVKIEYNLVKNKRIHNNSQVILVSEATIQGNDYFDEKDPITKETPIIYKLFPFAIDCGNDSICSTDLSIDAYFPKLRENDTTVKFIVGSNKYLQFRVNVMNKNDTETSYETILYVEFPSGIEISLMPSECRKVTNVDRSPEYCEFHHRTSNHYIQCDIDHSLFSSHEREVSIILNLNDLHGSVAEYISVCAATASTEVNPTDNFKKIKLHLQYDADITIAGKAETEQFDFNDQKTEEGNQIDLVHSYEVQKIGDSPVEKVEIEMFIPYAIKDENGEFFEFLQLQLQNNQDGQQIPCNSEKGIHKIKGSMNVIDAKGSNQRNFTATQAPSNRTLYLNCSSLPKTVHPEIKCIRVNCTSQPFPDNQVTAKVKLLMQLDTESLKKAKKEKDIILLETFGKVAVVSPVDLNQPLENRPDQIWTSTMILGDIPAKKVPAWLIALAIIIGILILGLLGYGLYKAGFFKRKKKEELDSLKNQITTQEDFNADSRENIT